MNVSPEVRERCSLLSDSALYEKAIEFVVQHQSVSSAQLNGMLQYARAWTDLTRFVEHQRSRDWTQSQRTEHYKVFYDDLYQALRQLERDAAGFVPAGLPRREQQTQTDLYAGLLAREFVRHLVAEAQLVQALGQVDRRPAPSQGAGRPREGR